MTSLFRDWSLRAHIRVIQEAGTDRSISREHRKDGRLGVIMKPWELKHSECIDKTLTIAQANAEGS